jgi:hypothetical protein
VEIATDLDDSQNVIKELEFNWFWIIRW